MIGGDVMMMMGIMIVGCVDLLSCIYGISIEIYLDSMLSSIY